MVGGIRVPPSVFQHRHTGTTPRRGKGKTGWQVSSVSLSTQKWEIQYLTRQRSSALMPTRATDQGTTLWSSVNETMSNEKSILEVLIYFHFSGWQSWWVDFTYCIARLLWQFLKKYKFKWFLVSQAHELSEKEQTETARRTANPVIFVFLITDLPW